MAEQGTEPRTATASEGAGGRGSLTIADKVGAQIARRAALSIDNVVPYSSTIGSLLGGAMPVGAVYPSATLDMSSAAPVVDATIAVHWPCAITDVCRSVRQHVADELARLTGVRPSRVNVTVAQIVSDTQVAALKKGFVELPAPPSGSAADQQAQEVLP